MTVQYTDEQVAELREHSSYDLAAVKAFEEKHDISHRSVMAKVKALGLTYVTKTGSATKTAPVVTSMGTGLSKEACAEQIQKHLNLHLPSLIKMNVTDLRDMNDRVHRALNAKVNYT